MNVALEGSLELLTVKWLSFQGKKVSSNPQIGVRKSDEGS